VTKQSRFDMLGLQRLLQHGVIQEIDLTNREVVGGPLVGVDQAELLLRNPFA
jgi:hypothetical protein